VVGRLAGAVSLRIGIRPTELLGFHESKVEDLFLDAAILSKSVPNESNSLTDDIIRKRGKWAAELARHERTQSNN